MKTVLLSVIGLNPQVLTETLYAINTQGSKVDEIHIITTRSGKERVYATLLSPKDGMFGPPPKADEEKPEPVIEPSPN